MCETKLTKQPNYEESNKFQQDFYTNPVEFRKYTNFEIKKLGYGLLSNIAKGFPYLADTVLNLKGFGWSGPESPALLKALQQNFIAQFQYTKRIPQFVYWKQNKPDNKKVREKKTKDGIIFSDEINFEIKSILMYDQKTFEIMKFSDSVQNLGKQLIGEIQQTEKIKQSKKKSPIKI